MSAAIFVPMMIDIPGGSHTWLVAAHQKASSLLLVSSSLLSSSSQRKAEQISALLNLIISFGLGAVILIAISAISMVCYPRRPDVEGGSYEDRRVSKRYRLLTIGLILRRFHVVGIDSQQFLV